MIQGIPIEEFDCWINRSQSKSLQVIEFDYRSNQMDWSKQSNSTKFLHFFPIHSIEFFLRLASIDIRLTLIAIKCNFNYGNSTPWVKINFTKLLLSPKNSHKCYNDWNDKKSAVKKCSFAVEFIHKTARLKCSKICIFTSTAKLKCHKKYFLLETTKLWFKIPRNFLFFGKKLHLNSYFCSHRKFSCKICQNRENAIKENLIFANTAIS